MSDIVTMTRAELEEALVRAFTQGVPPDLHIALSHEGSRDFSGLDLRGAHLEECWLDEANLSHCLFGEAHLEGAILVLSNLTGADFAHAHLSKAVLTVILDAEGASFVGARMIYVHAKNSNFQKASFIGANLSKAILCGSDFREADLSGADLRESDCSWAEFSLANLREADLRGANLTNCDFRGADLTDALMEGANITDILMNDAISWKQHTTATRRFTMKGHEWNDLV